MIPRSSKFMKAIPHPAAPRGFTLIELLVVIAIIAPGGPVAARPGHGQDQGQGRSSED